MPTNLQSFGYLKKEETTIKKYSWLVQMANDNETLQDTLNALEEKGFEIFAVASNVYQDFTSFTIIARKSTRLGAGAGYVAGTYLDRERKD